MGGPGGPAGVSRSEFQDAMRALRSALVSRGAGLPLSRSLHAAPHLVRDHNMLGNALLVRGTRARQRVTGTTGREASDTQTDCDLPFKTPC